MTFTLQLDFVQGDESVATASADAARYAKRFGLKSKVVAENGPGGGNPLVEFTGTEAQLKHMLEDYCNELDEVDEFFADAQVAS